MSRKLSNTHNSLVSIIMPVRNPNLQYFNQAVNSVLTQDLTDFTLFIIDDGDVSSDVLSRVKDLDERIVVLQNHGNPGISRARNVALNIAQSKYVAFLDCDDVWLPERLISQVNFMEKNAIVVSHGAFEIIDSNGNTKSRMSAKRVVSFSDQLLKNRVANLTGMFNREVVGNILQEHIIHEDFIMWTKLIRQYGYSIRCPGCYSKYRMHGKNFTANKGHSWAARWMILQSALGQSRLKSTLLIILGAVMLSFNRLRSKF